MQAHRSTSCTCHPPPPTAHRHLGQRRTSWTRCAASQRTHVCTKALAYLWHLLDPGIYMIENVGDVHRLDSRGDQVVFTCRESCFDSKSGVLHEELLLLASTEEGLSAVELL